MSIIVELRKQKSMVNIILESRFGLSLIYFINLINIDFVLILLLQDIRKKV